MDIFTESCLYLSVILIGAVFIIVMCVIIPICLEGGEQEHQFDIKGGKKRWVTFLVLSCLCIGVICAIIGICGRQRVFKPMYKFKVQIEYIDGKKDTVIIESKFTPCISKDYGAYLLDSGWGVEPIYGVIRCKILSKELIQLW